MKKSIALAIAILVFGASPGLFHQKRLSALREDHRKLVAEAIKLGVTVDGSAATSEPRLTKRQRENRDKQTALVANEVVNFARETEGVEKSGGKPDDEFQKRALEMMSRLMELDASQLKSVIARLRDDSQISSETRGNIIAFAIMSMAEDHPEAAVALFAESADLMEKSMLGEHVISSAISRWANINPVAALEWIQKNAEAHPEFDSEEAKVGLIAGAAVNDPKLAFKLLGELDIDESMDAINAIVMTGHENPEQRDAVMAALREHLGTITDEAERAEIRSKALEIFARTADKGGFDSLTKWLNGSKFSPQEKEEFAGGLTYFTTKEDTGRWVEWISGNLPSASVPEPVREIVGEWTQQDYVAAGQWLSGTPDGPAKTAAVEAYAEAVAEYEPQIAAQWAMTLPPGPGRESTLRAVYQNWPVSDPEGAAQFARDHGLE